MQLPQSDNCVKCGNQHVGQECAVNPVVFNWKYGGENVLLYGSWSQFQVGVPLFKSKQAPYFYTVTLNLQRGTYQFKFNVDRVWRHDPNDRIIGDSYGSFNNQIEVLPRKLMSNDSDENDQEQQIEEVLFRHNHKDSVRLKIKTDLDCNEVFLKGSWDNWQGLIQMKRKYLVFAQQYSNYCYLQLVPGSYQYKFIIGGQWVYDQSLPNVENSFNNKNNIIHVKKRDTKFVQVNYNKVYFTQYQIVNCKFERINGLSMNCIGDELYIFGGYGSNFTNNFYKMNSVTHALNLIEDSKDPAPDPRAYHNAIRYGNKIIFYGGLNSNKVFDDYFVFNTANKQWVQSHPKGQLPPPREKATLTLLSSDQTIVYFGGYYCSNDMEVQKVYNDMHCLNLVNMMWTELKFDNTDEIPPARYAHSATQIRDKMYMFGGQGISHGHYTPNFNDIWMVDFSALKVEWKNLSSLCKGAPPSPRHGHTAVLLQRHIFIFGGKGEGPRDFLGDLYHFDPVSLIWSKPEIEGTCPAPRCYHAAESFHNNELWIVGGNAGFNMMNTRKNPHLYIMSFEEKDDDDTWMNSPVNNYDTRSQDKIYDFRDDEFIFQLEKIKSAVSK